MSFMKRAFSSFLVLVVFAWIMPLGNFIKPSQEKTACNGQRPMHMCSMMGGAAKKAPSGVSLMNSGGLNNSPKAQASAGGNDVLLGANMLFFNRTQARFIADNNIFLHSFSSSPIEYPPQGFAL